jgi:hypothetical protein
LVPFDTFPDIDFFKKYVFSTFLKTVWKTYECQIIACTWFKNIKLYYWFFYIKKKQLDILQWWWFWYPIDGKLIYIYFVSSFKKVKKQVEF